MNLTMCLSVMLYVFIRHARKATKIGTHTGISQIKYIWGQ